MEEPAAVGEITAESAPEAPEPQTVEDVSLEAAGKAINASIEKEPIIDKVEFARTIANVKG